MTDRLRLMRLCSAILALSPESNKFGLSIGSLQALKRLANNAEESSNEDAIATPALTAADIAGARAPTVPQKFPENYDPARPHTPEQIDAFKQGYTDRMAGRPITAFGDARDEDDNLTDSYICGYDPLEELKMTLPEYVECNRLEVAKYLAETGIEIRGPLPRNSCEFREDRHYDPTVDVLLVNLLNNIGSIKDGFHDALATLRNALGTPAMAIDSESLLVKLVDKPGLAAAMRAVVASDIADAHAATAHMDPTAKKAIELLFHIQDGGFLCEDMGTEGPAITRRIDELTKLLGLRGRAWRQGLREGE